MQQHSNAGQITSDLKTLCRMVRPKQATQPAATPQSQTSISCILRYSFFCVVGLLGAVWYTDNHLTMDSSCWSSTAKFSDKSSSWVGTFQVYPPKSETGAKSSNCYGCSVQSKGVRLIHSEHLQC
ncbi:hypothetical protein FKM82_022335 [Ascaphus truei]